MTVGSKPKVLVDQDRRRNRGDPEQLPEPVAFIRNDLRTKIMLLSHATAVVLWRVTDNDYVALSLRSNSVKVLKCQAARDAFRRDEQQGSLATTKRIAVDGMSVEVGRHKCRHWRARSAALLARQAAATSLQAIDSTYQSKQDKRLERYKSPKQPIRNEERSADGHRRYLTGLGRVDTTERTRRPSSDVAESQREIRATPTATEAAAVR